MILTKVSFPAVPVLLGLGFMVCSVICRYLLDVLIENVVENAAYRYTCPHAFLIVFTIAAIMH